MNVNLNLLRYNKISPLQSFKGEIAEPKNKKDFSDDVFFINMNNYGTNKVWAAKMKRLALDVSKTISQDVVFENVLEQVQDGIYDINGFVYGIRRTVPEFFCIKNTDQRGGEYYERYMEKIKNSPQNEFIAKANEDNKSAKVSRIYLVPNQDDIIKIDYGFNPIYVNSNIKLASDAYDELKNAKSPRIEDINKCCATIYWLIAQGAPYCKGNDSIASILTKAIYHSYGVNISPLKKGISCDFEAFSTDLDEYMKNYPNFFQETPHL